MSEIGVYVHFPFCKRRCAYCDFFSDTRDALIPRYVDALCSQIEHRDAVKKADSVYFGGGTPSLMDPKSLEKIMNAIGSHFDLTPDCEITLEANPSSADEKKLAAYRSLGVNRLSLGIQSFDDRELKAVGRLHDSLTARLAIKAARKAGFERLSVDLIYGLPYQTMESFMRSLGEAARSGADHLSCYCLTLRENSPLLGLPLPDEELQREMYLYCCEYLEKAGFGQYEISNFARPGSYSRHNMKYWTGAEYAGLGAGAHGFEKGERYMIPEDLPGYIADPSKRTVTEIRDKGAKLEEYLIFGLRTSAGLDFSRLEALGGGKALKKLETLLPLWEKAGLAKINEKAFSLTPQGFFVSNSVIAELI